MNRTVSKRTTDTSNALRGGLTMWFARHAQTLFYTLGRLYRAPLSTLLSVTVIGIALALPAGLHVLVTNTRAIAGSFEGAARISVFLQHDVAADERDSLADVLRRRDDVAAVAVISAEQALAEFRAQSGFGGAIDALEENPLPAVLVVTPVTGATTQTMTNLAMTRLVEELRALPETDVVQLDAQWLQRLNAILEIVWRGIVVIAGMFALAVVIVIGNTIRLDIQNRREEIVVTKLIGATDAFIRRPFLYTGFWYGAAGGLMAWLLTGVALVIMETPVARLAGLYGSGFTLQGLGVAGGAALLAAGTLLGWLGSMLAVGRHLGEIEPK